MRPDGTPFHQGSRRFDDSAALPQIHVRLTVVELRSTPGDGGCGSREGAAVAVSTKPLTLDEFLRLPEEEPALELIDGVVSQKVSPKAKHSTLQAEIVNRVNNSPVASRLAHAWGELRTTFGGCSPVPDVAIYRVQRVPVDERGEVANDFTEPPDVAVEIVSPDQRVLPLVRKCVWYVDHGVPVALLVDPDDRSILSFGPNRVPRVLRGPDPIDFGDLLPGFTLTVQDLFNALRWTGKGGR
jgi:Uma2 family endonuclease